MIKNSDNYLKNYKGPYKKVVIPKDISDITAYVNEVLQNIEEHTVVSFETGVYLVSTAFVLKNKKDIIIEGNNSVFLQNFVSEEGTKSSDIFHVNDCEDITLRNFSIDTSGPVNISGKIADVGDDYLDLKLNNAIPFTGKEKFRAGYTFSEEGYPIYGLILNKEREKNVYDVIGGEICCTNPRWADIPYEKISEDTVRISSLLREPDGSFPENIPIEKGNTFCMRYIEYGPVACLFRNTHRVIIEDVNVHSFGGMVFVIVPRCSDFVFNRVVIAPKNPDSQLHSSDCDGIHTTGLMGKLLIQDCVFRSLGDDSLNAHTQVMRADYVTQNSVKIAYDKVKPIISPLWAEKGDVLFVYDSHTLKRKKDIIVKEFKDETVYFDSEMDIIADDVLVNSAYHPEITIDNCVSYNMRGRAYVIQGAKKLVVKNCEFYNVAGPAVYISSAFQSWLEGGRVENVEIYNNYISGCKTWATYLLAAIHIWIRSQYDGIVHNVHKNISIHDNVFENIKGQSVYVTATDTVSVKDNVLVNCGYENKELEINGCTNCTVENNTLI